VSSLDFLTGKDWARMLHFPGIGHRTLHMHTLVHFRVTPPTPIPSYPDHFSLRTHGVYLSTAFRSPTSAHGRDVLQFRILAISILSSVDIDSRTCAWCTTCSSSIRDPSVSRKVGIEVSIIKVSLHMNDLSWATGGCHRRDRLPYFVFNRVLD
jgi:hypothetical protein